MTQDDTTGVHIWLILMKAHQAMSQHAERSIEAAGICFSDFGAMEMLLHKGPLPINAIGEKLQLTSGALTAAVDRLEKKGLLERKFDANDRRVRMIHLTESGQVFIQEIFNQHKADMEKAVSGLDKKERIEVIRLLKKMGKEALKNLDS